MSPDPNNHVALTLFGMGSVGKSCISMRFVQGIFVEEYEPTISENFKKALTVDNYTYMVDIFDTAGMESTPALIRPTINQTDCFVLIFAINDSASFDQIRSYHDEISRVKNTDSFPCIIVGNKQDLSNGRQIEEKEAIDLAKELKALYIPSSAKTGQNIQKIMEEAVREVAKIKKPVVVQKKKWYESCLLI
ncbi:small GTP-binding protein, putative [Trichomonas vaginalis G3]|uniref:Small GTP-binding protein, putative n=1 Tax=Trichomonas vaginalis (strain ATCC PRA-98 / G3) TaxID=412133 RepID=A2EGL8_TRIV3|nr:GTPase protein [Trichomonas vaginalis G3]EAY08213.1 small GTP-binding protein, putative [Trichomonas vaginalis G3]KAI5519744.1 GTPase protein [Trichomonas vaginalis G3]|eukprot:XP_001320436.1 small GTP-binding protein [Trichomonas vaginalis G3]